MQERAIKAIELASLEVAEARLPLRVEDWKNLKREDFGTLLLHGYFHAEVVAQSRPRKVISVPISVVKFSWSTAHALQLQYEIYMFENWLLFFKPRDNSSGRTRRNMSDDEIAWSNLILAGRLLVRCIKQIDKDAAKPSSSTSLAGFEGQ